METHGKKSAIATTDHWQTARIAGIIPQSRITKSFLLEPVMPWPYSAGQHCSIRLTAPNGYQATRDYSLSSAPNTGQYEVTIAHAPHGEVSGWFSEHAEVGDNIEILGPIGKYFTWDSSSTQPIMLVAGGVGVTPLMSILRQHRLTHCQIPIGLLYSARSYDDIIFKQELLVPARAPEQLDFTLVDAAPQTWPYYNGLITGDMFTWPHLNRAAVYVCGPNGFVEAATTILVNDLALDPSNIKTERFG